MDFMRAWALNTPCDGCGVRRQAICAGLPDEAFVMLGAMGRRRSLSRGQVLNWEGEANLTVGTLLSGALKISGTTGDGRELIVGLAWPSDFVGNPVAGRTAFRVTALSDSSLCLFDRGEFCDLAERAPELGRELLRRTLGDLDRARAFMLLLGRMSAGERLAALLIEIVERFSDPATGESAVLLPLRRQEIADVLGLTIETVSRQLGKMKDAGIIQMPDHRRIILKDPSRLRAMAAD